MAVFMVALQSLVSLAYIELEEEKETNKAAGRPVIWFSAGGSGTQYIAASLWSLFNGPHYSPLSEANGSCLIWLHQ